MVKDMVKEEERYFNLGTALGCRLIRSPGLLKNGCLGAEMPESRMRGMQDDDADAAFRPSAEEKENEITPFIHG
jgi:hypothetical protein